MKIIIQGDRHIGKTTLIRKLIENSDFSVGGFFTKKAAGEDCDKTYIHPASVKDSERTYSEDNLVGSCRAGETMSKHPEVFERLGVKYLKDSFGCDIIIMDELGFLENDALEFKKLVLEIFSGGYNIIAAVKSKENDFIKSVKMCCPEAVYKITEENRDSLFNILLEKLRMSEENNEGIND